MYKNFRLQMAKKIDTMGYPLISDGVEEGVYPQTLKKEVKEALDQYNSVGALMKITDSFTAFPTSEILSILTDSLKHAGAGVAATFFGNKAEKAVWAGHDFSADRDELSVELLSDDLTKVKARKFGKTTNGIFAKQKWSVLVSGSRGVAMGNALFTQVLINDHGFQSYLSDPQKWVPKLETLLQNKAYILGTIVKQLTQQSDLPVLMKVFILKALGSKNVEKVLNAWKTITGSPEISKPAEEFINHYNNIAFAAGKFKADIFVAAATAACNKTKTRSHTDTYPTGSISPPAIIVTTTVTWGVDVENWLNSKDGPKRYGLRTKSSPDNVKRSSKSPSPFGCFAAGTQVLLKSGVIDIATLEEDDEVVGKTGVLGIVSSEKVCRVLEHDTPIFGFNGEEPFFLACHPFWTYDGWKALDPDSAKMENPSIKIGQLTEEYSVQRVKNYSNGVIEYEWVDIVSMDFSTLKAGSRVYGVHTREGPRTYHANGYLVLQNYPEMTSARILEGMDNISTREQHFMHKKLKELGPVLHKIMGPAPTDAILKLAQGYQERLHKPKPKQNKLLLIDLCLPNIRLTHVAGKHNHWDHHMPSKLSLISGHLFVDDDYVDHVHVTEDDKISWTRQVHKANRRWEHGSLKLYPDKLQGHAYIALTHGRDDSKSVASATFEATSHVNTYHCFKSAHPISDDSPHSVHEEFGGLKMGTEVVDGTLKRVGLINLPAMGDEYDDLNHHIIFSVDAKFQLSVVVHVPTDFQEMLEYTELSAKFSWDYSSFSGHCIKYDPSKPGNEGDHFVWRGELYKADHPHLQDMKRIVRSKAMQSTIHHTEHSTRRDHVTRLGEKPPSPMMSYVSLLTDNHLSLQHLFTLPPPDSQQLHDVTFGLIQKAMKYKMDDELRENILGVVKPSDMSGELIDVANKYDSFFTDRFANAYMMNGLAQSEHYQDKITEVQRNKLLYYWAGSDAGCLGHDADYNDVNNEITRVAFIQLLPEIKNYMNSSQGALYWARELFNKLMSPEVLNGLALTTDLERTTPIIQKQSMVLYCLAPEENFGLQFNNKIVTTRLTEMSSFFNGNASESEQMKEIAGDHMRELITQILTGGDETTGEIQEELRRQLEEAMEEYGIEMSDNVKESTKDALEHMETAIDFVINVFNNGAGTMITRISKSVNKWMKENPKMVKIGKFLSTGLTMVVWGMSVYFTVKSFMSWSDLDTVKRAQLITETIALTFKSIAMLPEVIEGIQTACAKGKAGFEFLKDWMEVTRSQAAEEGVELSLIEEGARSDAAVGEAISRGGVVAGEDLVQSATTWQKFFNVVEKFANVTGVIAMMVGVVAMGFQISNDFKTDAPVAQKAVDILQGLTLGIATTAATVGLFIESTVIIPFIGIVCAVIGIILALVSIYLIHREKPKPKPTKVDLYVEGDGSTFVNGLTAPSREWLDNYHKEHPDDGR